MIAALTAQRTAADDQVANELRKQLEDARSSAAAQTATLVDTNRQFAEAEAKRAAAEERSALDCLCMCMHNYLYKIWIEQPCVACAACLSPAHVAAMLVSAWP
jgi:hypothetical protein